MSGIIQPKVICECCRVEFEAVRKGVRFCSRKCSKKVYHKEWASKNKERLKEYGLSYYNENKERILIHKKEYGKEHKEHKAQYAKTYRENNREYFTKAARERRKNNIHEYILDIERRRINKVLSLTNTTKSNRTLKLVGCDKETLVKHIENQFDNKMNRENRGTYWHIDHIIPCNHYDLTIEENQLKCFNYRNLRPLEAKENISKNDTLDLDLVKHYGIEDLL